MIIILLCIYYFYELFLMPRFVTLLQQPSFWICTGLLFFYACSFPVFGFTNFVGSLPKVIRHNLAFLLYVLNVLLYSMFSIAFLCRLRITKSSRSLSLAA
jgi:ABC-type dipeptide/oligopeptide/nickel transport system permease component